MAASPKVPSQHDIYCCSVRLAAGFTAGYVFLIGQLSSSASFELRVTFFQVVDEVLRVCRPLKMAARAPGCLPAACPVGVGVAG